MNETEGYRGIKAVSLRYVERMKIGEASGLYRKEAGGTDSLYGSYHAAHVLDLFGELESVPHLDGWADTFRRRQTVQGYFSNSPEDLHVERSPRDMDPVWHSTRGVIWALRILGRRPDGPLGFLEPLLEKGALRRWVKGYDWSNAWAAGNQILAGATALLAQRDWFGEADVDRVMEREMFPALEELQDPETGYWGTQFRSDLAAGLFGTIHIAPIYFAQGWPLKHLERNADSTLSLQRADGSFWPGGSDCPDFDGAYMMLNLTRLTDYRREDLDAAARRYLDHALMHEDCDGVGWRLHRRDSGPADWRPRPHFIWDEGARAAREELRDDDPARTHIMLGSWFYPLSVALVSMQLGDTGYEGPYRLNGMSLHQMNAPENRGPG